MSERTIVIIEGKCAFNRWSSDNPYVGDTDMIRKLYDDYNGKHIRVTIEVIKAKKEDDD